MYEGKVYRPPSEARSLILQVTTGCPYNQCDFCKMYKDKDFRIKSVTEIKDDIKYAVQHYGNHYKSVFLADGNSILMKTDDLKEVLKSIKEKFAEVERITTYGSARFVNLKSLEEMKQLRKAGLTRIHTGMESGDRNVLKRINKGTTPKEIINAGKLVKKADIELSEYYMVGVGGKKLTSRHATNSADVLNQINPDFIRLRTFIPMENTVLYQKYKEDEFTLLNPHEALEETKKLIENLDGIESQVLSDHISNYWNVEGKLPEDKTMMLDEIETALETDITKFRDPARGSL